MSDFDRWLEGFRERLEDDDRRDRVRVEQVERDFQRGKELAREQREIYESRGSDDG